MLFMSTGSRWTYHSSQSSIIVIELSYRVRVRNLALKGNNKTKIVILQGQVLPFWFTESSTKV